MNKATIAPLLEGYKAFKEKHFVKSKTFEDLIKYGQKPKALVIACCDSRADPAIITNCEPGELFVIRNVANLVPKFEGDHKHHGTSAALEFGVCSLGIKDIIILGHSHCGGIKALMEENNENEKSSDFIDTWMDVANAAKQRCIKECSKESIDKQLHHCEKLSLLISLKNLSTFPWIKERLEKGAISLHAWYFDLETGSLETYHQTSNEFRPV